jgi:hypothetical protein
MKNRIRIAGWAFIGALWMVVILMIIDNTRP